MGIAKTASNAKSGDNDVSSPSSPESGSLNSGAPLLATGQAAPQQPSDGAKNKKKAPSTRGWLLSRQELRRRAKGVFWLFVFFILFAFTIIVAATLAENFQYGLFSGTSKTWQQRYSLPGMMSHDRGSSKLRDSSCIHRRIIWKDGLGCSEVIHDLGSHWSAIVDHRTQRCLLFDMHDTQVLDCPTFYPWAMDQRAGVPICKGPLANMAPFRRIMHHVSCIEDTNISYTGNVIQPLCTHYRLFSVDRVVVQFFDRNFRRLARRSVDSGLETLPMNQTKSGFFNLDLVKSSLKHNVMASLVKKFLKLHQDMKQRAMKGPLGIELGLLRGNNSNTEIPEPDPVLDKPFQDEISVAMNDIIGTEMPASDKARKMKKQAKKKPGLLQNLAAAAKEHSASRFPNNEAMSNIQQNGDLKQDKPISFWEVAYAAVDENGNMIETSTFKDLSKKIKEGKSGLLNVQGR